MLWSTRGGDGAVVQKFLIVAHLVVEEEDRLLLRIQHLLELEHRESVQVHNSKFKLVFKVGCS